MSDQHSKHPLLHRLAETAGLSVHWKNYRDEDRTVAPETLQSVLKALGIRAGSEHECRESLQQLREEAARQIPGLLIGRIDESITLPASLGREVQADQTVLLRDENGRETEVKISRDDRGQLRLPSPQQPGYYDCRLDQRGLRLAVAPRCCRSVRDLTGKDRAWGVTAQLYSLRRHGDGGIGDFSALKDFAVGMAAAGADAVAVSPVHALFSADRSHYSPYAPSSRLFTNVLHIDPEQTFSAGLLQSCLRREQLGDLHRQLESNALIDWPESARVKLTALRCLWEETQAELMDSATPLGRDFENFRIEGGEALQSHATFEALHAHHLAQSSDAWHWRYWEARYRDHNSIAVKRFAADHRNEVLFHSFLQWLADRGLADAHAACKQAGAGVGLIADLAVGTDSGGSHAWSREEDMLTGLSVGAPPDLLNHEGQDWGLTSFSPRALLSHGYGPMIEMLRDSLRHAGGLRIDHILGLRRLWVVPEGASPQEGVYLQFPQRDLLNLIALESWRHDAVIVGEDLGTVPHNFRQELAEHGLLGMAVLWFEKDHKLFIDPSRWRRTALATTTTHDLPTVAGWWRSRDLDWNERLDRLPENRSRDDLEQEREEERTALWAAFRHAGLANGERPDRDDPAPVVDQALAFIANTPAPLALAPVEDLLGLEEQPNLPGTIEEHPNWRRRLPLPAHEVAGQPQVQRRLAILNQARPAPDNGGQQD